MSCPFESEVLLLGDGLAPTPRRFVLEAHLALCPECAHVEATLEAVRETLRRGAEAPLGAIDSALAALPQRPRRGALAWGAASLAAAAAAILLWPGGAEPQLPLRPDPAAPAMAAAEPRDPERDPLLRLPPPSMLTPALVSRLQDLDPAAEDYEERTAALTEVVRRSGAPGIAELAALLGGTDPTLLAPALEVAARLASATLVDPLVRLLDRPEWAARAARALAATRSPRALPGLATALGGPAAAEACEALVAIGGREAARLLDARLTSPEGESEELELLGAIARTDPGLAARRCCSAPFSAVVAKILARHGPSLLPELRRIAAGPDDFAASGAARAIGVLRDEASFEDLLRLAGRAPTAPAACQALLALGSGRGVEAALRAASRWPAAETAFVGAAHAERFLLERLDAGTFTERRAALRLLAACGGAGTVSRISRGRLDRSLLPGAVAALGAIGGEEAIQALALLLPEKGLRGEVVRALGETRDPRALPLLRNLLAREGCTREVCAALARIENAESADMLLDLVLDGSGRGEASRALASMPPSIVVPLLLGRLEGQDVRGRAREMLVRIAGSDLGPGRERWEEWWGGRH